MNILFDVILGEEVIQSTVGCALEVRVAKVRNGLSRGRDCEQLP